jgi:hypothetical protein
MHLSRVAVWLGLAVTAGTAVLGEQKAESTGPADVRLERLVYFLKANRCPVVDLAADFLAAADRHGLDWRLLPSISIVETGGGRQQRKNNIFGWDSARTGFASVREGIYTVADRLANSKLYRNKGLEDILRTYNRHPGYGNRVKWFMLKLDASDPTAELSSTRPIPAPDSAVWRRSVVDLASVPAPPAHWGARPLALRSE